MPASVLLTSATPVPSPVCSIFVLLDPFAEGINIYLKINKLELLLARGKQEPDDETKGVDPGGDEEDDAPSFDVMLVISQDDTCQIGTHNTRYRRHCVRKKGAGAASVRRKTVKDFQSVPEVGECDLTAVGHAHQDARVVGRDVKVIHLEARVGESHGTAGDRHQRHCQRHRICKPDRYQSAACEQQEG